MRILSSGEVQLVKCGPLGAVSNNNAFTDTREHKGGRQHGTDSSELWPWDCTAHILLTTCLCCLSSLITSASTFVNKWLFMLTGASTCLLSLWF